MSGSILVTRSVSSSRKPRYALATGNNSRKVFPVTVTDKSGKVRVISGDIIKPKRKLKNRKSKVQRVTYRLSDQSVTGDSVSFDLAVMKKMGSIHAE